MAGMDGIEILRRIKTSWPETEIIILTGHANTEIAMTGMEIDAFDYLMKPTSLEDLLYKPLDAGAPAAVTEEAHLASSLAQDTEEQQAVTVFPVEEMEPPHKHF